jgi:hypothetical protein
MTIDDVIAAIRHEIDWCVYVHAKTRPHPDSNDWAAGKLYAYRHTLSWLMQLSLSQPNPTDPVQLPLPFPF